MEEKIVGVVAEFNPFHNGHKYQIDEISKQRPRIKIAVISGNFVQRGEVSIINKFMKAELAILEGYDIVVELPVYYSIQNADVFGEFSVKILNELGCNIQVFGVEEENTEKLYSIIRLQNKREYLDKLKNYVKMGNSYIKSHEMVLAEYGYRDVYKSNNILALSYIRTIERNSFNIRPYGIKRVGSGYNEEVSYGNIASATMIRSKEINEVSNFVPKNTFYMLSKRVYRNHEEKIFEWFKYLFNVKTKNELIKVYDFNDSMYNRVNKYIKDATDYYDFVNKFKSRNFSINRLRRIMLNLILYIDSEDIKLYDEIKYIRVLSVNEKGAKYIKELNNPKVFVNWKDIEKNITNKLIKIEKNAFAFYEILTKEKEILNLKYIK
ncbi:nucleotidyltransferase family protein [Streptobacillus felis]|uniref:tRNA(Met) cytidine acetate ligase n=1 Tax=Streptobacillus felis TaxID=1384509 RepID=A0A7Z0PEM4_9FUSO|nr:nucleotidyltransferase family protein [Streptobacillus felis]NYV27821.1 nucleotidyltransferase family protein [Streptobacillus felis]